MVLVGCLLFSILVSFIGLALFALARRLFSSERRKNATSVASAYFSTIGTIYAVVLGFMFYGVWNQFQEAARCVDLEANSLAQIVRLTAPFPESVNDSIRTVVKEYATDMVNYEWDAMQRGEESKQGLDAYKKLATIITDMRPTTPAQVNASSELLSNFTDFMKYRRLRVLRAHDEFPVILWVVLWAGGLITIAFSCLFELNDTRLHVLKIVGLSVMVGLVVYAIWEIYGPFQGLVTVGPGSFQSLLDHMAQGAI